MNERADRVARPLRCHSGPALAIVLLLMPVAMSCSGDSAGVADGLVFVRRVDGSNEIMRARLSDGRVRALTRSADREERWPYWSDPAGRLVFQTESPGGESDLVFWDREARRAVPIRESPRRDERWPVWSPDGLRLAFAFRGGRPDAGIAWLNLANGVTQVLAFSDRADFFFRPAFAPDGEALVSQRRGPDGTGSRLWILAAGKPPRPLTGDPRWFDMKPWFTRDGDLVVFSRRPAAGGPRDIAAISAGGGAVRTLIGTPDADDHSARPSPTRDEIAFVSNRDGNFDVFIAGLDGGNHRALTRSADRDEFAPRWSPDGERLALTVHPVGSTGPLVVSNSRIVVIDREGRVLLDVPGAMPDWMPPWR